MIERQLSVETVAAKPSQEREAWPLVRRRCLSEVPATPAAPTHPDAFLRLWLPTAFWRRDQMPGAAAHKSRASRRAAEWIAGNSESQQEQVWLRDSETGQGHGVQHD